MRYSLEIEQDHITGMNQSHTKQASEATFDIQVRRTAFRVRETLAEVSAAIGVDVSQPRSAARHLAIDKTLAWKISKITTGSDPVGALSMVPGAASQRTLLLAFERAGAPIELVDRTRDALAEFQQLIEDHATDRETFEIMLSSMTADGQQGREELQRRAAFHGNSAIWGIHCRVRTWSYVVCPSEDPDFGDLAVIGSFVDVRSLRRDARWTLATIAALADDGRPIAGNPIQSLRPGSPAFDGMPVLSEYCRGEVPAIERVFRADGVTQYRLTGGEVGNSGLFTWTIGWRYPRVVTRWATERDRTGEFALNMLIPAEAAQLDLFVHRGFWPRLEPELGVYSLLAGEAPVAHASSDRQKLSLVQSVDQLHEDPLELAVHDVPNYSKMIGSTMAAMGHQTSDFAGYRVRMKYPVLSTSICMHMDLPQRPTV